MSDAKPGDLWCSTCEVKPNARGIDDQADGTAKHGPCGQLLDVVPEPAAKPRKQAAKSRRPARPAPLNVREIGNYGNRPADILAVVLELMEDGDIVGASRDAEGWHLTIRLPSKEA